MLLATLLQCIGLAAWPYSANYVAAEDNTSELMHRYLRAAREQALAQRGSATGGYL